MKINKIEILRRSAKRRIGGVMVEYVLMLVFIVMLAFIGMKTFGGAVGGKMSNNSNSVVNAIQ